MTEKVSRLKRGIPTGTGISAELIIECWLAPIEICRVVESFVHEVIDPNGVIAKFKDTGLWVRSIQVKKDWKYITQCATGVNFPESYECGQSLRGHTCTSWTLAHPTIKQFFFHLIIQFC